VLILKGNRSKGGYFMSDRPEITAKFNELGGTARFGQQNGPEQDAVRRGEEPAVGKAHPPAHSGRVRHYQNGSIYWHKLTGAHAVFGLIRKKWLAMGGHRSVLQFPISDEVPTSAGNGMKTTFEGGIVVWRSGTSEAFEVHGAIRAKYSALGGSSGLLGYPTTDETTTPDGVGRFNHFDGGSIYWKPSIGAHEIHGPIRDYWAENGWERNSLLGYPISDLLPAGPNGADRYIDFENGVVYLRAGENRAGYRDPDPNLSVPSINVPGLAAPAVASAIQNVNQALDARDLPVDVSVSVTDGPEFLALPGQPPLNPTSDYRVTPQRVVNRRLKLHVDLEVHVENLPNPSVDLDLNVEVHINAARNAVVATLTSYHSHTEADFPLNLAFGADEINQELGKALKNIPDTVISPLPPGVQLLSVKTMDNGNILVFR